MKVSKFWMVHRIGCSSPPTREHDSLEAACNEAARLALEYPSESFAVLQLARVCQARAPVEWTNYTVAP